MWCTTESRPLDRTIPSSLWRNTFARIPTVFGRLVFLASLRDQNTGYYEHSGMAQVYGFEEADRVIRESHRQVFQEWICYRLDEQKADLSLYLSGLEADRYRVLETWTRLSPYRNLMPTEVRDMEKRLYLTDLEILLDLLKNEYDVVVPDPDA